MTLLALLVAVTSCGKDAIPTAPAGPEQNRLVAQVIVEPGDALLSPDDTRQLTVVVKSARGQVVNGRSVTWRSLDESVALVDQNGSLFGANEGSAKIRATVEGVSGTATVDVRGQVVDVVFSQAPDELYEGEANQLSATYVYSNGATRPAGRLQWSSLNRSIAVVDGEGLLLGTGEGTTTIEASGRGISSRRSFRIKKVPIKSVVVSGPSTNLTVGDSELFWAEVYGPSDRRLTRDVAWTSSNTSVATVDVNGLVNAVGSGQATISASVQGVTGSLLIHVTSPGGSGGGSGGGAVTPPPGMVTDLTVIFPELGWAMLSFTEVDDGTGQAANYEVRYFDQGMQGRWGEAFTVTSGSCTAPVRGSRPGRTLSCHVGGLHASMSYEFQVVAFRGTLGQGAAFGSLSNIAGATTSAPSISVDVIPTSFTLDVGQARQLQANVLDSYGNAVEGSVTWTTSSSAVATVNSGGSAAGISAGNATLRATYQSSISGTSAATVVQPSTGTEGGSTGGSTGGGGGGSGSLKQVAIDLTNNAGPGPNEPSGFAQLDPTVAGNWDILYDYGQHQECSPVDGRCFQNPALGTGTFGHGPLLHHTWPTGFGDDSLWPGTRGRSGGTRLNFLDTSLRTREGYVSVRFQLGPNIQIGPTGLKIVGIKKPKRGGSAQMAWILATGMNGGRLTLDQKIASGDFQAPNSPRAVSSNLHFQSGVTYHLEVYIKTNSSAGVPNGVATVWVNGTRHIHVTDVVWYADEITEAAKAKWVVGALIDPIPSARVPAPENWIKYDDFYVSTR